MRIWLCDWVGLFEPEYCPCVCVRGEDSVVKPDRDVCELGPAIPRARGDGGLELDKAVGRAVVDVATVAQTPNLRYGCDTKTCKSYGTMWCVPTASKL